MATPTASAGAKRSREDDGDDDLAQKKRNRPTLDTSGSGSVSSGSWHHDSVINTPTASAQQHQQSKYDSDDQSSLMSEPGSPQDISMSSGDEDLADAATFSQSPEETFNPASRINSSSPWRGDRSRNQRIPTPFVPTAIRTSSRPSQHIRHRHPQENFSSDQLEVPSPIDEDEVPTPPSAAEAAGSQLSMLTVSDMDVEAEDLNAVPTITLDPARHGGELDSLPEERMMTPEADVDAMMDGGADRVVVMKRRQRSGAQSNGSVSPARPSGLGGGGGPKRGFSMGFRADCEKCRMRMPGHMNHFIS